jgi:hypothetical protein
MTRRQIWTIALVAACGGDSGDSSTGAEGSTGTSGIGSASAMSTTTAADTSGASSAGSGGADSGSSTTGGDGSGLVVPCGDDGTGDAHLEIICFFQLDGDPMEPAATIEHFVGDWQGEPALYLRLTLAPWFADNTYGMNAIGWDTHAHKFGDLVGSDHAEIHLKDPSGATVFHFSTDYITADDTAASGYLDLGIWGGEGMMIEGDETQVLAATSSISRNLNDRGYTDYLVDSPATDENYTPNPDAPEWDYRVVYEVWIALSGFAMEQLPVQACIENIHASPSKLSSNTVDVIPDECPPGWGCWKTGGCGDCDAYDPDQGDLCDPSAGGIPEP